MKNLKRSHRWLSVGVLVTCLWGFTTPVSGGVFLQEFLGNFPDAVQITAQFDTFSNLQINGDTINDTGFLFTIGNTSWGDGLSSSFANNPDGDFALNDILLSSAAAAISAAQPFGIYSFGAMLPVGAGAFTSAPTGWNMNIRANPLMPPNIALEVNFSINLGVPNGLLFDPFASGIDPLFTNPETGPVSFFISTLSANILDNLLITRNGFPALDVMTSMAWAENGAVTNAFTAPGEPFDGVELRPRGQLALIPGPSALGILILAGLRTRRRRLSV